MSVKFRKITVRTGRRRRLAIAPLPLAAVALTSPALARDLTFYGNAEKVPSYTLHCPKGMQDGVTASDTFILNQTGSFTDPTAFVPPLTGDGNMLVRPPLPDGLTKEDNVGVSGVPQGFFTAVDGPVIPAANGCAISGSSGGFSGNGFNVTGASGTINGLTVAGPGMLGFGNLTVVGQTVFGASGNYPLGAFNFDSGRPVFNLNGDHAPVALTVTGGALTSGTLQLVATTTNAAFPGSLTLSGGVYTADKTQVAGSFGALQDPQTGIAGQITTAQTVTVSNGAKLVGTTELDLVGISRAADPTHVGMTTLSVMGATVQGGIMAIAAGANGYASGAADADAMLSLGAGSKLIADTSLLIGATGNGALDVAPGATVTDREAYLGFATGSKGSATISGARWDNAGFLAVGNNGLGTLTISNGATVYDTGQFGNGFVAGLQGSAGSSATITGQGSLWQVDRFFQVGGADNGTLTVTQGGKLVTGDNLTVGLSSTAIGQLNVTQGGQVVADSLTGIGTASLILGSGASTSGTLVVDGAGSSVTSKQSAIVGLNGAGNLEVSNGATLTVDGQQFRVGRNSGSYGLVTLVGAGSQITADNATAYVGYQGKGVVTIDKGATMTAGAMEIGSLSGGDGRVEIKDGGALKVSNLNGASLTLGSQNGSQGVLSLTGAGASLSVGPRIVIGDAGIGTMTVQQGAALDLSQKIVTIGKSTGGLGQLTIDSSGGTTNVALGSVIVGDAGKGSLNIIGDAFGATGVTLTGANVRLGSQAGGAGVLTIENARLDLGADIVGSGITVGDQGDGTFVVGKNAQVTAKNLSVGLEASGTHSFTVDGQGAKLAVADAIKLGVAEGSQAALTVLAGGQAQADSIDSQVHASSVVKITVSGSDGGGGASKLTVKNILSLAGGVVDLSVLNGGQLSAETMQFSALNGFNDAGPALTVDGMGSKASYGFDLKLLTFNPARVSNGGQLVWSGGIAGLLATASIFDRLSVLSGGRFEGPDTTIHDGGTLYVSGDGSSAKTMDLDVREGGAISLSQKGTLEADTVTIEKNGALAIASGATATLKSLNISGIVSASGDGTTISLGGAGGADVTALASNSGLLDISAGAQVTVNGGTDITGSNGAFSLNVHDQGSLTFASNKGILYNIVTLDNANLSVSNGNIAFTGGALSSFNLIDGAAFTVDGQQSSVSGLRTITTSPGSTITVGNGAQLPVFRGISMFSTFVETSTGVLALGTQFGALTGNPGGLFGFGGQTIAFPNPVGSGLVTWQRQTDGYLLIGVDGLLLGTGTVHGDVLNLGLLHPGHSPGVITINGDYLQLAPGQLALSIGPNDYGRLVVNGSATFNGGSIVLDSYQGAQPKLGQTYTFVQASGGVSGHVDNVISPFPGITFSTTISGGALSAQLSHAPNYFSIFAQTHNQLAVARALDMLALGAPTGAAGILSNSLSYASATDLAGAFDQLSGEAYASTKGVLLDDSRFSRGAALDRLRGAFGGVAAPAVPWMALAPGDKAPAIAPDFIDFGKLVFWGQGFDAWGNANGGSVGAAKLSHGASGFFLGGDAPAFGDWRFGAYGGYNGANLSVGARASSGKSDAFHAGVYAGAQWGALGLRLGAAYAGQDIDIHRSVSFAGFADAPYRRYGAGVFQLFGEAGYKLDAGFAALEPFGNLALVRLHTNGFSEFGDAAALSTQGGDTNAAFGTLGLRFAKNLPIFGAPLALDGMVGWRHAFGDVTPWMTASLAGGDRFTVAGAPIDRDALVIEPGLDLAVMPNATLGVHYAGQFGPHGNSRSIKGAFKINF